MMSPRDVMIVCSIILAGKPLHMCRQSAMVRLCFCQHPRQLTILTESLECHCFVSEPIFVSVTYIYIYICSVVVCKAPMVN